jgi:hypothetical protein
MTDLNLTVPPVDPSPDAWKIRHRIVVGSLAFIAASLVYAQVFEQTEAIAQTTITMGFTTGGGIIGAYVFGKAWETIRTAR